MKPYRLIQTPWQGAEEAGQPIIRLLGLRPLRPPMRVSIPLSGPLRFRVILPVVIIQRWDVQLWTSIPLAAGTSARGMEHCNPIWQAVIIRLWVWVPWQAAREIIVRLLDLMR